MVCGGHSLLVFAIVVSTVINPSAAAIMEEPIEESSSEEADITLPLFCIEEIGGYCTDGTCNPGYKHVNATCLDPVTPNCCGPTQKKKCEMLSPPGIWTPAGTLYYHGCPHGSHRTNISNLGGQCCQWNAITVENCGEVSGGYCTSGLSCSAGFEPVNAHCNSALNNTCCGRVIPTCPEGFFHTKGSTQCFKLVADVPVNWFEAKKMCEDNYTSLAQPNDDVALELREYLYKSYPLIFPDRSRSITVRSSTDGAIPWNGVWMGMRRVYEYQWMDGKSLPDSDKLWVPDNANHRVLTAYHHITPYNVPITECALMLVSKEYASSDWNPTQVYRNINCAREGFYTLCETVNNLQRLGHQ